MQKKLNQPSARLVLFNKPYGVLSQFTDTEDRETLANYVFEKGVYVAGRLDRDSEGLLLLTDNGKLQHNIANPRHKTWKTYYVQVEGAPDESAQKKLTDGVKLKDGQTLPAQVRLIQAPDWLWERQPPVRFRKTVPDHWLEIRIREGKNRQVRRMTAAVGLPTLRLIRVAIGQWQLDQLSPGQYRVETLLVQEEKYELGSTRNRIQHRGKSGKVSHRKRKS